MLFGKKRLPAADLSERRRLAHDNLKIAIDQAVKDAIDGKVDRRVIADVLEGRAQACRTQWATTAPIM
jgi:hypothetical protein